MRQIQHAVEQSVEKIRQVSKNEYRAEIMEWQVEQVETIQQAVEVPQIQEQISQMTKIVKGLVLCA